MITPERLDLMQKQWFRIMESHLVSAEAIYTLFDQLVARYCEPHRYYHTLEHIGEMLRIVNKLHHSPATFLELYLSVWFHDVVYEPGENTNELRSAELAVEWLQKAGMSQELTNRVSELVRATAHFESQAHIANDETRTHLLDADLAILGSSEARYSRYAQDIRREYSNVSDIDYRKNRIIVLQHFLDRERIFYTPILFAEGEEAARNNLRNELSQLA